MSKYIRDVKDENFQVLSRYAKNEFSQVQIRKLENKILTSFFIASKMSVFNSLRQLLILARLRFSMIGLLLCKQTDKNSSLAHKLNNK